MSTPFNIQGDPVNISSGNFNVGNARQLPIPASASLARGVLSILAAGNSTYGELQMISRTAGGTLRTTTIYNPITASGDVAWILPGANPAGNGYLLTFSTAGVMSFTDPATLGGGAPTGAQYLTLALDGGLSAERVFTPGTGLSATDGGANAAYTLNSVWKRTGTLLEPATAGDDLQVDTIIGGSGAGDDLTLSSTSHATKGDVRVLDNSRLIAAGTRAGSAMLWGENDSTTAASMGVFGTHTGATGIGYGVYGYTASSDNAAYGGKFVRILNMSWQDIAELSTHPATPPATDGRVWLADASVNAWEDHKLFLTDEDGNVHDLTCQHKQTFAVAHGATTTANNLMCDYLTGAIPLMTAPAFTITTNCTATLPAAIPTYGSYTESFGRFAWTSQSAPTPDVRGQFMCGTVCRDFGGGVFFSVRLRVGTVNRIGSCVLTLSDGTNYATLNITPTTAFATYTSTYTDTSGWNTGPLFIALWVKDSGTNFGAITVDIESFAIEQWVD